MKQKSVNHQSNKATLKFNEQFVHACFNLVKKWKPCSRGQNNTCVNESLRFNPVRQANDFCETPKYFQGRKGSLEI